MARLPLTRFGLGVATLFGLLMVSVPAHAQDDSSDDDDTFNLDDDDQDASDVKVERLKEKDSIDDALPGEDDVKIAPEGEEGELNFDDEFDDDKEVGAQGEGQDTARIYRDYLTSVEDLGPDEESLAWERYVKKYPNTLFRSRIDERIEVLSQEMYDDRVETKGGGRFEDAGTAELNFAQPLLLESIDPRNQLRAGVDLGLPNWIGLILTGERQLTREWSVGAGVRTRYTGTNLEAGTRYAIIKSARTQMLLTGIGDLHINVNPMHFGFRPQLGFGKRISLPNSMYLDAQLQAGSDLLVVQGTFSPRLVGGANITIVPSKTVRAYIETSTYMKDMFWQETIQDTQFDGGIFRFNVVTFGLKFITRKGATTDRFETGIGASVPYTSNYWRYHYGAITADTHYYY